MAEQLHEEPVKQAGVYKWLRDPTILSPARVFAIERALNLQPGALSRGLGFLPVEAVAHGGVLAAIEADPLLTDFAKYSLARMYEAMVEKLTQQRKREKQAQRKAAPAPPAARTKRR